MIDQLVMHMAAVRAHRTSACRHTTDDGVGCIENRQAENQERHRKRDDCVEFEQTHDGHGRQHVAEQKVEPVSPMKMRGGVEVVRHKADARAGERRHR